MTRSEQRDAFVKLLQQHRSQLFGYIYALLHNLHDTEDVYQEACLILWSKFDKYQPGTNFVSWSCEIARLEVLNFLRKRGRSQSIFSVDLQLELASLQSKVGDDGSHAYQEALSDCLKKLPNGDAQLVRQCYGAGQSFKQVAHSVGRSPKSVYDALGRIRRALLNCVKSALAGQEAL